MTMVRYASRFVFRSPTPDPSPDELGEGHEGIRESRELRPLLSHPSLSPSPRWGEAAGG
jgi:hypothetical protein